MPSRSEECTFLAHHQNGSRKLLRFKPHDLGSMIAEARQKGPANFESLAAVYCSRNMAQTKELLISLGVDPSDPAAFQKGFYRLAEIHHGLGLLAWRRGMARNRNSFTWTADDDAALLMLVVVSTRSGMSERGAINKIVNDRSLVKRFPYRAQGHRTSSHRRSPTGERSDRSALERHRSALWTRWKKLKRETRAGGWERQLSALKLDPLHSLELTLPDPSIPAWVKSKMVKSTRL